MFLHLSFFKHTMAFLEIALNKGGVQCFCILFKNIRWRSQGLRLTTVVCNVFAAFLKQTMAFLGIAFNKSGAQCFCLTAVAFNVFASCLKTDDGVLRDCV